LRAARPQSLPSLSAELTFLLHAVFRLDDYVPDKWRPLYDNYKKQLVDFLVRTGVVYAPVSEGSDRPELMRARTAHTDLVDELHRAEGRLGNVKKQLEKDWGRDWEWRKLDGMCIEKDAGE
jgi:hypothetical protein